MDALKNALRELMASALLGFDSMVLDAAAVLSDRSATVWSEILNISEYLKPFCYVLIGICLLIELAQTASKVDVIKWEHGLKICVKMVLARVFIDIAPTFLEACYFQAADWISLVGASGSSVGMEINSHITSLINEVTGLWGILGLFVSLFIVVLAIKICGLMVMVIAFGRMFELYVYLAVSPLPCAFFPLDGGQGLFNRITGKFLRSFAAVCLQGVMMVVCIRIFDSIIFNVIAEGAAAAASGAGTVAVSDLCYTMLMGSIVLVMSVMKCGGWAKSILDAA